MTEPLIGLPAPAKLNLFLHVLGRRLDGYHLLQTLFVFLDWGDDIDLLPAPPGVIENLTPMAGVPPELDLSVRAARLLAAAAGQAGLGVQIRLTKRIPLGGGLGGGSSDAATVLLGLNRLWQLGFSRARLQALGLQLGADVPVFVGGQAAFGEGVGDKLTPVTLELPWYLVAWPPLMVTTAQIFAAPELTRNSLPVKMADFVAGFGRNDLQPVVEKRYPAVAQLLEILGSWGVARMSGSGACCFVPFQREEDARSALAALPLPFKGFVARGVVKHPLRDWL
jgi:4-diphosphocytidyl-2-C-methyl-D-erythritol kinase